VRLLRTRIRNFRNLTEVDLEPGPRTTVLVGRNGQGKTNTLEAIYFAATLRPLRATRLTELLQFGSTAAAEVASTWELKGGPREYAVRVEGSHRQISVDAKRVTKLDDYFGEVVVVAFTPDDLAVVKGAPEERRRFIDRAVFGRFPAYLSESRDYARALKARNRILREGGDEAMREAFDAQVARLGARVWRRRLSLLEELEPFTQQVFEAVGRIQAPLRVRYRPAVVEIDEGMSEEQLTSILAEVLDEKLPLDRERRFTSVGPHADDLSMSLGGKSARTYASQGQQRAIVLALKIGEIENLRSHHGDYPLLLLDDVSSELDPERNGWLMDYLSRLETQAVLSTTDEALVQTIAAGSSAMYEVSAGTVRPRR
jgi:DNA replication and repair protein RecF